MRAETVEPIVVALITDRSHIKAGCVGKLEVEDTTNQNAKGGYQPRLAQESQEYTQSGSAEGHLNAGFLFALTCVHQQGTDNAEGQVAGKESRYQQVAVCSSASPSTFLFLFYVLD